VRLVIADTGPINYLVLIGHIEILPALFEKVILPSAVRDELTDPDTPPVVRDWIANPPGWLEIRSTSGAATVRDLGAGETEAIALANRTPFRTAADGRETGVKAARRCGLEVTGTLGVLSRAGQLGIIDLAQAFERIKQTSFRYPQEIMDQFLGENFGKR
jgi:predicted nucleic acid-binding protein